MQLHILDHPLTHHVTIATNGVLATSTPDLPPTIIVPEWDMWWLSLGYKKQECEGKQFIFLPKGTNFNLTYPGYSMWEPSDRPKIEAILERERAEPAPGHVPSKAAADGGL